MKLVVIDGQGGGVGKSIVAQIRRDLPEAELVAVGTNSAATNAMLRAGATAGATGESAVQYNCRDADVIAGPIGIAFAGSMYGEISPAIAAAVSGSRAQKLLIPMVQCSAQVIGASENPLPVYISLLGEAVRKLAGIDSFSKTVI